jgi:two-component system response regulator LytT
VKIKKPIIFTTAYDQYAIEVFRFNSIYYLLKPITAKSLSDSLEKYDTLRTALIAPEIDYQHLLELLKKEHKEHKQRFLVKQGNKFLTVTIEEIALFYAEEKYVFLLKKDGRKCIINFTLDELENILDPVLFCRVNRKYILGIQTIQEVQVYYKGRLKVIAPLLKDTEILVSNEKAADFKKWLER